MSSPTPVMLEAFEEAELKALEEAGWVIRRSEGNPAMFVGEKGTRRVYGRWNQLVEQVLDRRRGKP